MALDQEYFDSIHIDVVKKKYYNANKVEAVFADIRKQAQALQDENAELRRQLAEKSDPSAEITDAVYSAQSVYRAIIERANERAEAILAQAEQQRLAILDENQRQRDYAVQAVERCLQRVRGQQETALNTLTAAWQDFLCGLYPDEAALLPIHSDLPEDLERKGGRLARGAFALETDLNIPKTRREALGFHGVFLYG